MVVGGGIEPPVFTIRSEFYRLVSSPLDIPHDESYLKMVGMVGFEPTLDGF